MVQYIHEALAVEVHVFAIKLSTKLGGNSTNCRPENMHLHLLTARPAAKVEALTNPPDPPLASHLTPLSMRTTNKELSANSFMTKMMQLRSTELRVLRFTFFRVSVLNITHLSHHSFYFEPYFGEVLKKAT